MKKTHAEHIIMKSSVTKHYGYSLCLLCNNSFKLHKNARLYSNLVTGSFLFQLEAVGSLQKSSSSWTLWRFVICFLVVHCTRTGTIYTHSWLRPGLYVAQSSNIIHMNLIHFRCCIHVAMMDSVCWTNLIPQTNSILFRHHCNDEFHCWN